MNNVFITGNLTRDPELVSPKGSDYSLLKFSVANNDERRKNEKGEYESVASFFQCEYWTKNPQKWLKDLVKGTMVVVQGRLKQDQWLDKDSQQNRQAVKIIVEKFPIPVPHEKHDSGQPISSPPSGGPENFNGDDIPF